MRLAAALLLLGVLTVQATVHAQELTGPILVDEDWTVNEGERLLLGPGAVLTGAGRLRVHGALEARGSPDQPVQLAVPLDLLGNASVTLRHVRVWGVDGAAILVQGGTLDAEGLLVEANGVGVLADPLQDATLRLRDAAFRDHGESAVTLRGRVDASLQRASLATNAQNVLFLPAEGARLALEDARLSSPTTGAPSLLARAEDGVAAALSTRNVTLDGGDVGIRIEGAGIRLASENDTFHRVRVALSVDEGEANVTAATFDTLERDVDAGPAARLAFRDVRFTPAAAPVPGPPPPSHGLSAWWVVGGALAVAGGAVGWARLRPRPAAVPEPLDAPPEPEASPPDLAGPLSDLERRILQDVAAHPGTPQAAVAKRLGMTRQALHYHVKKLEARRLIRKEAHGRETRCTVAPGVEALLK